MNILKNYKIGNNKGYSLIELVIVLAVFMVTIGVLIDIFVSIVWHQKRILQEQELFNQTSYAMEYMSKALRMAGKDITGDCLGELGKIYVLTHCNGGEEEMCNGIKFINQSDNNICQEFFVDYNTDPSNPTLKEIKGNLSAQYILSEHLNLNYVKFVLNADETKKDSSADDFVQPRITILMKVKSQFGSDQQEKIIQTTISQRNLNVQ